MIIIVGDSHSNAIGRAMNQDPHCVPQELRDRYTRMVVRTVMPGFRFRQKFFEEREDGIAFLHGARELMAELIGGNGVIQKGEDVYGFSFGFHPSIMLRQEFWADYSLLPGESGKNYISQAAFREIVIEENQYALAFARELKQREIPSFFLIAPPLRRAMIVRQSAFASEAELKGIHEAYIATMRAEFTAIGASLIQPPDVTDPDGFLKPKFDNRGEDDVHHANPPYGKLVWKEIGKFLGV